MSSFTKGSQDLREWVERRAMSQVEAAAFIGIEYSLFNKYVLGTRRAPLETAVKIQRATGIPVEAWASEAVDEPVLSGSEGREKRR